ncbi:diiron oxygenase [soil metagenome]
MTSTTALPAGRRAEDRRFDDHRADELVRRLSRQSVEKHYDAFADIDWDRPDLALDPADPRLELFEFDVLAQTEWYRAQPDDVRARVGLHRIAACMKTGWHFENLLQRGLLIYAFRLPNGTPEFRYIQHEVAEESQHTMMFQEFVDRTGLPVRGMPRFMVKLAELVALPAARRRPALFFFMVLGGEDPVDHLQKRQLRAGTGHPLVQRIMKIHITEEARHVSFARQRLQRSVPRLGRVSRFALSIAVPVVLGIMTPLMIDPPTELTRSGVPRRVLREARRSVGHRALLRESVAKPRRLAADLGLMNPVSRTVWRLVRLGDR